VLGAALALLAGSVLAAPAHADTASEGPNTGALTSFEEFFTEVEEQGADGSEVTVDDSGTQVADVIDGIGPEPVPVEAKVPASSADTITISAGGQPVLSLDVPGNGSAATQANDQTFVFDGADGFVATAVDATTVETFHVVADATAPSEFRTTVNLLPGQALATNEDGLVALVDLSGAPVVFVDAPKAVDAAGAEFPVELWVEGDEVVVGFDHGSEDVVYPVLVDPIWYYAGYEYKLNDAEFSYCKWPSRWGLCKAMYDHANAATSAAQSSGLPGALNGRQDAFRHCYWSARMRIGHGFDKAKEFGDRHEQSNGQPATEKDMDLKNNSIGRGVGAGRNNSTAKSECLRLAKAGSLYIIKSSKVQKG
jgi:hypothetical protein